MVAVVLLVVTGVLTASQALSKMLSMLNPISC